MKIHDLNKQLWAQNEYWRPHWQSIQELMLPYRGRLEEEQVQQNDGKERADKRYEGTATKALRILSAGMHGGLTSPSSRWFRLGFADRELTKYGPIRGWLDIVEEITYSALRRSNFYTAVQNIYLECGGFGTACLFEESMSNGYGVWFRVITIGDYALSVDRQGRVNTLFRRDWMTINQLVEAFGAENIPEDYANRMKDNPFQYVKIFHGVQPRVKRNVNMIDRMNLPYQSVYFENGKDDILREGGYEDFPYMCPRWDVIGSNVFGYSPGMDALPDVRSLNSITADLLSAIEKEVNPPVNVPEELWDDIDLLPGGRNPSSTNAKVEATYQISPNLNAGVGLKQDFKYEIGEWFYTPLFVLTAQPNATATEIAAKNEEQLVQLGPVIQRMFTELLNPVIKRTFNILYKQGFIPPPPEEIAGQPMEIEYISTLAQAQKLVGVQKLERFTAFVGGLAQLDPAALDNVDFDDVVQKHADGTGIQASSLRSMAEKTRIRKERAAALEREQRTQLAMQQAQTAQSMSNAKLSDKNLLSEVTGATQ